MTKDTVECRVLGTLRAMPAMDPQGDKPARPKMIQGYAALFNSPTNIGGMFDEQIAPGAFTDSIQKDDVRCLFNHDSNHVLGRTGASTLSLSEDRTGLKFECQPPDTQWARDLMTSIERGDVSQCSFQFEAITQEWDVSGDVPLRTLVRCQLFDVSPVTFPAYADTSVGVRSLTQAREATDAERKAAEAAAEEIAKAERAKNFDAMRLRIQRKKAHAARNARQD